MSFHEAGSFNKGKKEGGITGCLLNHAETQRQGEHGGLAKGQLTRRNGDSNGPIEDLKKVKAALNKKRSKCLTSADITQYAGIWAAHRQAENGNVRRKLAASMSSFKWGRKDINPSSCKAHWTDNLPAFGTGHGSFASRMASSAKEIKNKMVTGNGFTLKEAVALVGGAHSFGKIRSQHFSGMAGPWVVGGDTKGGVFGNKFFKFGVKVQADIGGSRGIRVGRGKAFGSNFGNWFGSNKNHPAWLDTDVCLITNKNFSEISKRFARDENQFCDSFVRGMNKMRELGAKR